MGGRQRRVLALTCCGGCGRPRQPAGRRAGPPANRTAGGAAAGLRAPRLACRACCVPHCSCSPSSSRRRPLPTTTGCAWSRSCCWAVTWGRTSGEGRRTAAPGQPAAAGRRVRGKGRAERRLGPAFHDPPCMPSLSFDRPSLPACIHPSTGQAASCTTPATSCGSARCGRCSCRRRWVSSTCTTTTCCTGAPTAGGGCQPGPGRAGPAVNACTF